MRGAHIAKDGPTLVGLSLGVRPFVAALEFATGTEAYVVSKPGPAFVADALADLGATTGSTQGRTMWSPTSAARSRPASRRSWYEPASTKSGRGDRTNGRGRVDRRCAVAPGLLGRNRHALRPAPSNPALLSAIAVPSPLRGRWSTHPGELDLGATRARIEQRFHLGPRGVFVFSISPGLVHTAMTESHWTVDAPWTPPDCAPRLVCALATGEFDALTGRYLHAEHDSPQALRGRIEEIQAGDLNEIRLRR